jgi:hypothetical protein
MQIDILPTPNIAGKTDSEKLNNLISYTTELYNILRVLLSSLDTKNFTEELAEKIENSIQEHQDLNEYATRAYVNKEDSSLQGSIDGVASDLANHNHDSSYAPSGHDHNSKYAPKTHNHDGSYAPSGHDHNSKYAPKTHYHEGYALSDHKHDYVYAPYYNDYATETWVKNYVKSQLP